MTQALDTNILVRALIGDDEKQTKKVYQLFKNAERNRETLYVPTLVIAELIWVLENTLNIPKNEIIQSCELLITNPILKFENERLLPRFIQEAADFKGNLGDCLIGISARLAGNATTLTFDKKASKNSEYFTLLK